MNRSLRVLATCMIVGMLAGCTALPDLVSYESMNGNGTVITQEFALDGFDAVSIGSSFEATIQYGEMPQITVTTDENIMPEVNVTQEGSRVRIELARRIIFRTTELRVEVTLPTLEALTLDGASKATLAGFGHIDALKIDLSGATGLTGSVSADTIDLDVAGASEVTLSGAAERLSIDVSGASKANLAELQVAIADVRLEGASKADITASEIIDVVASGASTLVYGGDVQSPNATTSGASLVRPRQD